jgi:hypothetical protein
VQCSSYFLSLKGAFDFILVVEHIPRMPVQIALAVRFVRTSFLVVPKGATSCPGVHRPGPAGRRLVLAVKEPVRVRESEFDEPSLGRRQFG